MKASLENSHGKKISLHFTLTSKGMPWNCPAPSGGVQLYMAQGKNSTTAPWISFVKAFGLVNLFASNDECDFITQARASWSPSMREAFMYLELYTSSTSCRKIFALPKGILYFSPDHICFGYLRKNWWLQITLCYGQHKKQIITVGRVQFVQLLFRININCQDF